MVRSVCSRERLSHVAARHIGVLPDDCVADVGDRNLVSRQPVRIHPNVDGAVQPADWILIFADTRRTLELRLHDLVGQLGEFTHRTFRRQRNGHHRRRITVELADDRWIDVTGKISVTPAIRSRTS